MRHVTSQLPNGAPQPAGNSGNRGMNKRAKGKGKGKGKARTVITLRLLPERDVRLAADESGALFFNVGAFSDVPQDKILASVRQVFATARKRARVVGTKLRPTADFRPLTNDLISLLPDARFGDESIKRIFPIIEAYRRCWSAMDGNEVWKEGPQYPEYDIGLHPALYRYGNVELRVIEDYLLKPDSVRSALIEITAKMNSEKDMYAESKGATGLIHDDTEWNLRRFITNAGFYVAADPEIAWTALQDWSERYISALTHSHLSWSNFKAHFFPRIQRALHVRSGFVPRYVEAPKARRIYDNMSGREVLFVSPLAHIVSEQAASGRIWNLYAEYQIPRFRVRAIPAFVSTWPNRPHSDWSDTFSRLCTSVRSAYRERSFDFFIASCGCYGLPLCEFARSEFGCATLYVGHHAHALFGILPSASQNIRSEMWAESDLAKYENMDRIDNGRYLDTEHRMATGPRSKNAR